MDDTTISTNDSVSEKMTTAKDSLQVDTDLTEQMSGLTTESTTFDSTLTTPQTNRSSFWTTTNSTSDNSGSSNSSSSDQKSWQQFYDNLDREKEKKRTPPKATRTAKFHETIQTANELLRLSESEKFEDKTFDDLNDDQKAIIVLMILKGMHEAFGPSLNENAIKLVKALDETTKEHKRIKSFVRPGGDLKTPLASVMERSYNTFVYGDTNLRENWNGPSSTTIFKKHPEMRPFIHVLSEDSCLCTYAACSSLLFYHSFNNKDTNNDDGEIIKMNISRYIRDEVGGMEIANLTLTGTKGAHLDKVLLALLQSFGTPECQDFTKFSATDDEQVNYYYLQNVLGGGRPLVFAIECFEALADIKQTKYSGKFSDYINTAKRPKDVSQRGYHAVLCVGIQPRDGATPPMLVVQDSNPKRPYFSIGLDLLMDMGIDDLHFFTIPMKWRFNKNKDYVMNPKTRSLVCGSPMAVDKAGNPFIVKTAKPPNPDFWRYFDVVDPNDGPFAVMT